MRSIKQHGLNKPCRFHDDDFIKRIRASPDCKEVSFPNGGKYNNSLSILSLVNQHSILNVGHWFALTEASGTLREIRLFTGL